MKTIATRRYLGYTINKDGRFYTVIDPSGTEVVGSIPTLASAKCSVKRAVQGEEAYTYYTYTPESK